MAYCQEDKDKDSVDKMVLDFIQSSRHSISNSNALNQEQLDRVKNLFDDCLSYVINYSNNMKLPTLIICNSINKYSAILPVKESQSIYKYYLLYDIYLNTINRAFDIVFFNERDPGHDLWKLAYELYAEDATLDNDEILTIYYGLNKIALGEFELQSTDSCDLQFVLDVQERYIICHELGHWIYKMTKNDDLGHLLNINFCESFDRLVEDIKAILYDAFDQYGKIYKDKDYIALIQEQYKIADEKQEIIEECFSDALAYAMVFDHIDKEYPNNKSKKLFAGQALFLEMMNLQLLAMQHMSVSEQSFESAASIRITFLRNYVGLYFEDDEKSFESMIEETVVRYEHRITDIILECFAELEERANNVYDALFINGKLNVNEIIGL